MPSTGWPCSTVVEPWLAFPPKLEERRGDAPFPDYDAEQILAYANG